MEHARSPLVEAITSLGRRLRLVFRPPMETARQPSDVPARVPEVEFVAYAADCVVSGFIRLDDERLTDLLNAYDEYQLVDVHVANLATGEGQEVKEVLVRRDELMVVHATGPRGRRERRLRTRSFPMALRIGPFDITGQLHCTPGVKPLDSFARRRAMVPFTDASIEYDCAGVRQQLRVSSVIVNRRLVEWISEKPAEAGGMLALAASRIDPGAKDMTGYVRTGASVLGARTP